MGDAQATWTMHTGQFTTWDGSSLFCRTWEGAVDAPRALILVHRGHEHSARLQSLVEGLNLPGFRAFAFDTRGHGRSANGNGQAGDYDAWLRDFHAFMRHVHTAHRIAYEDMAIVANSVGAVTATAWVHDYAFPVRALVLAAPAFRVRLYVPGAIPLLRLLGRVHRRAAVKSYVRARMLTHDPAEIAAYEADPLITHDIPVSALLGLHDTATRLIDNAAAIRVPTLVLAAGRDYVVDNAAQLTFHARLGSRRKAYHLYPDFHHAVFHEEGRADAFARARAFIEDAFREPPAAAATASAPTDGDEHSWDEYRRLRQPAGALGSFAYGLQSAAMRTAGRLSRGIRIGLDTGFDSGPSLDHVYRNRAEGVSPLGRLIDRGYLDAIGWRGIRTRRESVIRFLGEAMRRVRAEGRVPRLLDVAAGPGRYVLDALRLDAPTGEADAASAVLRDIDERNLAAGRALAAEQGLRTARFERGDAFDPHGLSGLSPRPNIAVVSGLYELFPDNAQVLASLRAIAAALEEGGFLVYTGQPWHPQIEMIARTLVNHRGQPWIMRRRSQAEMDALVREAGFAKEDGTIDRFGIFTVSLARRPAGQGGEGRGAD